MNDIETKKAIVGGLLEIMKAAVEEENRLMLVGVKSKLGFLQDKVWGCIKAVVGMPVEEAAGGFQSDLWLKDALDFAVGKLSKEEAVNRIVNWDKRV
ncbi:hypothetical protein DRW41_17165 [Neobacillus piezotolerans]|uniref:Uncharacterized protein n=1 Tax=Neobacillus piezotolerans TaxID=2259171 RepID=A0A3D8GLW9_9BACI|nr:hypothetical protein [Neobacillus piezotolerans]RDU35470.1 hypothetical protein DRW41_17165 [Neobacillus piezotolerans]